MKVNKAKLVEIIKEEIDKILYEEITTWAAQRPKGPGRVGPGGRIMHGPGHSGPGHTSRLPGAGGQGGYGHHWRQPRYPGGARSWRGMRIGGQFMSRFSRLIAPIATRLPVLCGGPWRAAACATVGVAIVSYLYWKGSDDHDPSIDPIKEPMFPLFVQCGKKVEAWVFPTKEDRQKYMEELKQGGGSAGCPGYKSPEGFPRPPKMQIPEMPNIDLPKREKYPKLKKMNVPEECQWHVPPRNKKEFNCFYQDLEASNSRKAKQVLTTYGKDYKFKDEHLIAYVDMLRKKFKHDLKPTHHELQKYRWYLGMPPAIKRLFGSKD